MSLVDKDPDRDGAQGAAAHAKRAGASRTVRKRPSEILRERRQRIRRRRLTAAGVVLALILAAFYVQGPFHSPTSPPASLNYGPRATPGPIPTPAAPPTSGPTEPTSHGNWTRNWRIATIQRS